jgi:hypothetical protein
MAEEELDEDFARVTGRADNADIHGAGKELRVGGRRQ